jgi:hypothetical protein
MFRAISSWFSGGQIVLTFILIMWRIGWAPNSIPIYSYNQQDATLHSLFISGNYSTCFGWYFHQSSGAHTTVPTASGICHTVTAICRYRGRVGTGLSVPPTGAHTTVSTASGICHTVTAICRYRARIGTGLSVPPTAHSNRFQLFHDSGI